MNIIESLLKTNDSSILISVLLRKDHIKSENIFYSDIFKYERELTKHDLIPKYELLQRSFIHGNFQTIFPADTSLHCLRIKLPLHLLEIVQRQWRGSIKKKMLGLRPATLLKKRLWHRCFHVNFAEFLRTHLLKNSSERLLLILRICQN